MNFGETLQLITSTVMNQKGSLLCNFTCQSLKERLTKLLLISNYKFWERGFGVGPVWDRCPSLVQSAKPKYVGSSRTNMAAKTLPMDAGSKLLACGLDRHSISPVRINSNSSVGHTESFTPYPLNCYLSAPCPATPAQILPFICAKGTMP